MSLPRKSMGLDCIDRCATANLGIRIVGGGGILSRDDAGPYLDAGADDLFMGTANILSGATPEAVVE